MSVIHIYLKGRLLEKYILQERYDFFDGIDPHIIWNKLYILCISAIYIQVEISKCRIKYNVDGIIDDIFVIFRVFFWLEFFDDKKQHDYGYIYTHSDVYMVLSFVSSFTRFGVSDLRVDTRLVSRFLSVNAFVSELKWSAGIPTISLVSLL